jgi:hypothetical protein
LLQARSGLRALELASTIGLLLGLLGTVTGMIAAFQALQEAGARADPATLAGGIWEALLTTAAGMAVAIPAQIALAWFEGVVDRLAAGAELPRHLRLRDDPAGGEPEADDRLADRAGVAVGVAVRLGRHGAEVPDIQQRPRSAHDPHIGRQQSIHRQAIERGQQHSPRKVAGRAKKKNCSHAFF